ncbi:helix-turn-helix domain-containing protein [Olivibacter sp. SDN3]|uniref:AraC family transcriptional regulator n=1 Tax=unclassified Olivibacter TaxID=2632301 RepID=UPI001650E490|nr:helix-turn-helix transcriptional regulator [Olivibacter sp. SDN3]QNL50272.1 helix-turn-helix domain-containing protein [Olivibacter sp. SDN3]
MEDRFQIKDKSENKKPIKIAPFKKEIRKTTPHKHNNYFEILFLSQGSGSHYIDSRRFEVKPPIVYFIRREQVHYWELESEPDGYVIIIKKEFAERCLDAELKFLITKFSMLSSVTIVNDAPIQTLFQQLTAASEREGKYIFQVIEGLLKALLAMILEVADPITGKAGIDSNLYQSFVYLLSTNPVVKNTVQHYAELLKTSPQNLNAACRKAVDQPATDILNEFVVSEAKRLLHYTNKTITEISLQLNFTDVSHFVKYFKRITGSTPQKFRSTLN